MNAKASTLLLSLSLLVPAAAAAQPPRIDDVVRNLRNPDPESRYNALRMLREAKHVEAIPAVAPLVNDAEDAIQIEAIATELSFFVTDEQWAKAGLRHSFIIEVKPKAGAGAQAAFDLGPLGVWPRPVPPELTKALLKAVDDADQTVRIEAIYALGAIAPATLDAESTQALIKALDHYDPAIRQGAARVIGRLRVKAAADDLIKTVNDSQPPVRFAAMIALGQLREERAVNALSDQLKYYVKGEGAWSALDGLARIAHPSSVPIFTQYLANKDEYIRRTAVEGLAREGDQSQIAAFEAGLAKDASFLVRAAMAYALVKAGKDTVMPQLVGFLAHDKTSFQVSEYFMEMGESAATTLPGYLKDPNDDIRGNVAQLLGALGTSATIAELQPLTADKNKYVARAATLAIERIKMRGA